MKLLQADFGLNTVVNLNEAMIISNAEDRNPYIL